MSGGDDDARRVRAALDEIEPPEDVVARAQATAVRAVAAVAVVVGGRDEAAMPSTPAARAALSESALLGRAPWLAQPGGGARVQDVVPLPSLRFPPGTGYAEAATRLARSVATTGGLPPEAATAPALPVGAVWDPAADGPRLGLTAPFGYAVPSGRIRPLSVRLSPALSPAEAVTLARARAAGTLTPAQAEGLVVDVPRLPACQRLPRERPCDLEGPSS